MTYLAKNYNRKKISFKYGKGSYLFSTKNNKIKNIVDDRKFTDRSSFTIGVAACDIDSDGYEEIYFLNTDTYSGEKRYSDRLMDLKNNKRGRIKDYAEEFKVDYLEAERPWSIPCDIALPCATQNEINGDDAKVLLSNGCKVVSEGANMPSDPKAVSVFQESSILFGPGKAANAGGVATSGLEMSQNNMRLNWTRNEVDERLHQIMKDIHSSCVEYGSENETVNYVKGANIAGFIKVAEAMVDQGVV